MNEKLKNIITHLVKYINTNKTEHLRAANILLSDPAISTELHKVDSNTIIRQAEMFLEP